MVAIELAAVAGGLAQLLDEALLGLQDAGGAHRLGEQAAHLEHGVGLVGGHGAGVAGEAEHEVADQVVLRHERRHERTVDAHAPHQLLHPRRAAGQLR